MARIEITIDQAKKNPSAFLYIFAGDDFLNALQPKWANQIRIKRANQIIVLSRSVEKFYKKDLSEWKTIYAPEIRKAFVEIYATQPEDALIDLAMGRNVAGKNWAKGVFGIGATKRSDFKGTGASVNSENGHIVVDGKEMPVSDTIYGDDGAASQIVWRNEEYGVTYISQKDKNGKWYAGTYEDSVTGKRWNANGKEVNADEASSFWENVDFDWNDIADWLQKIVDWLIASFGGGNKETQQTQQIKPTDVLPNQTKDGFATQSGIGDIGALLLVAAAAGALIYTMPKSKK